MRPSDEERYVRVRVIGRGCKGSVLTMLHKVFLAFNLKVNSLFVSMGFAFIVIFGPLKRKKIFYKYYLRKHERSLFTGHVSFKGQKT